MNIALAEGAEDDHSAAPGSGSHFGAARRIYKAVTVLKVFCLSPPADLAKSVIICPQKLPDLAPAIKMDSNPIVL